LDNNTSNPKPGLLEYIPAVQTRPFNITSANSISSSARFTNSFDANSNSSSCTCTVGAGGTKVGLAACWEEELSVDAAPEQLVESDALLLLELLQLPGGFARYKVTMSCRCCVQYSSYLCAVQFMPVCSTIHTCVQYNSYLCAMRA
jgi:hypothetical protein